MDNSETEHLKYFLNQTSTIADYFENWLFPTDDRYKVTGNKKSIYSVLYDVFSDNYKQKPGNQNAIAHNCIGCNFEDSTSNILYFLKTNKNCLSTQYYLTLYTFLFYAHAERLAVIYKEIGYVNGKDFDWQSFPVLQSIKYWANFFKHPKASMLLHHPDFFIDTDPDKPNFLVNAVIDHEFVKTFYKASADNDLLRETLANKNYVKVFYPDLIETTKALCAEFSKIIDVIKNDPTVIEKLEPYTTIKSDLSV